MKTRSIAGVLFVIASSAVLAQPGNDLRSVKPIPPVGNEIAAGDRAELEAGVAQLGKQIDLLREQLREKPDLLALLPDIVVYYNAVRYPLVYHELIDVKNARAAIADAASRLEQLRAGHPDWLNVTGPRGYVSRIDGSVQPYVLYVPAGYKAQDKQTKYRFDFWCHGRGEDLMELKFIRTARDDAISDPKALDHFVVCLYGRYCCANKFAGEIDLLEALEDVKRRYPVDENRLVGVGFSMGGAAAWQFAVHYSDLFAAAAPGAGFSESREFLKIPQAEVDAMTPWQRALWHLYDCTDYAANLAMLPTVAYNGDIDGQKQAADMMEKAMAEEGLKLERLIGPKTGHKYEPETRKKLEARLDEICAKGRDPMPRQIRFTTWTLRYDRMFWITVDGLGKHWERARVDASITAPTSIEIKTSNVSSLILDVPAAISPLAPDAKIAITIDGGRRITLTSNNAKGLHDTLVKSGGEWSVSDPKAARSLRKVHGLQGPIDDAFMDSFIIVKPSGMPMNDKTGAWAKSECDHAIGHWQKQFRGEARVKNDVEVTEVDIRENNLVCFGDPSSNAILAKIAERLPIKWAGDKLVLGEKTFDAGHHVPALIYPNPLNPQRYVVLNSGFTFREFDYLNNARQTPKLADYAIIDVDSPMMPKAPGKIVEGGFFDERWRLGR